MSSAQRKRTLPLLAVLAVLATLAPGRAFADEAPELVRMRFLESGKQLLVSTSIPKLFDSAAYDQLDSGFTSTVVIRLWVYPKGGSEPISFSLVQRQVVYHLWDEVYTVRQSDAGGTRTVKVKYKAEALKLLTSLDGVPIAGLDKIPLLRHHVLAMVVELNPVSQETLAEVRRWLSNGSGGGLDRGGSFFGSFVSVFVNLKIPEADRVLRVRSQPFYRPEPVARRQP